MKKILILSLITVISVFAPSHYVMAKDISPYAQLLKNHVSQGTKDGITSALVDYEKWGRDPLHQQAMDLLVKTNPDSLSDREKMAFWINSYNLLTIDLIITHNEKESIKNLGSFLHSPWKYHSWTINGKNYTLHHIEHHMLRPMGDPRIHIAINCASLSCPDLLHEPYESSRLDKQLDQQTKLFLQNRTKGMLIDGYGVKISTLFKWFKKDFNKKNSPKSKGGVVEFINKHSNSGLSSVEHLKYLKYNWKLNAK